jgi:hypothetical protein
MSLTKYEVIYKTEDRKKCCKPKHNKQCIPREINQKIVFLNTNPVSTQGYQIGDIVINRVTFQLFSLTPLGWVLQGDMRGPAGMNGDPGQRGSLIFFQSTDPSVFSSLEDILVDNVVVYNDFDMLLNNVNFNVYWRQGNQWILQGNIKGSDGTDGNKIYFDSVDPISVIGYNDGDVWVNNVSNNVFNLVMGMWVFEGNIKGNPGTNGTNGINGAPGSQIYFDVVDPITIIGYNNGDVWINTVSDDVFSLQSGVWTFEGNIKGNPGTNGTNGINGAPGSQIYFDVVDPSTTIGYNNGDMWVNTTTFDVFSLQGGVWTFEGNIKGPSSVLINNTLYVDAQYGTPSGVREDLTKPYLTITQAMTSALLGDVIVVHPGIYNEDNITLKDNVNIFFEDSVILNNISTYIFNDASGSLSCDIIGYANINTTNGIMLLNNDSHINFHSNDLTSSSTAAMFQINSPTQGSLIVNSKNITTTNTSNVINLNGTCNIVINSVSITSSTQVIIISAVSLGTLNMNSETITSTEFIISNSDNFEIYVVSSDVVLNSADFAISIALSPAATATGKYVFNFNNLVCTQGLISSVGQDTNTIFHSVTLNIESITSTLTNHALIFTQFCFFLQTSNSINLTSTGAVSPIYNSYFTVGTFTCSSMVCSNETFIFFSEDPGILFAKTNYKIGNLVTNGPILSIFVAECTFEVNKLFATYSIIDFVGFQLAGYQIVIQINYASIIIQNTFTSPEIGYFNIPFINGSITFDFIECILSNAILFNITAGTIEISADKFFIDSTGNAIVIENREKLTVSIKYLTVSNSNFLILLLNSMCRMSIDYVLLTQSNMITCSQTSSFNYSGSNVNIISGYFLDSTSDLFIQSTITFDYFMAKGNYTFIFRNQGTNSFYIKGSLLNLIDSTDAPIQVLNGNMYLDIVETLVQNCVNTLKVDTLGEVYFNNDVFSTDTCPAFLLTNGTTYISGGVYSNLTAATDYILKISNLANLSMKIDTLLTTFSIMEITTSGKVWYECSQTETVGAFLPPSEVITVTASSANTEVTVGGYFKVTSNYVINLLGTIFPKLKILNSQFISVTNAINNSTSVVTPNVIVNPTISNTPTSGITIVPTGVFYVDPLITF